MIPAQLARFVPHLLYGAAFFPASTYAQSADVDFAYAVADSGDTLVKMNRHDGSAFEIIGNTNTSRIEAIAWNLSATVLYAANADDFGTLSLTNGNFNDFTGVFGNGDGGHGNIAIDDVDGLTTDPWTGVLYGSHREGDGGAPDDVLVQIDPSTGFIVQDAFGPGIDYVVINTDSLGLNIRDVDDIAMNPDDGQMYAVANSSGGNDHLITIDKTNGAVTLIGRLRLSDGTPINDIEGFSFFNDGTFYGTSGSGGSTPNRLWVIDTATGVMTLIGPFNSLSDYEAVADLTGGSNTVTGKVFKDNDSDGTFTAGDVGEQDVLVTIYRDDNGNGSIDSEDSLINTQLTDSSGDYNFEFALIGDFLVEIDTATLPTSYTGMTTDNLETASFTTFGNSDPNNDFGYITGGSIGDTVWLDLDGDGTQDPGEPGIPGITVDLSNGDSVVTDANGNYLFGNLAAGTYTVAVNTGTLPTGFVQTGDPDTTFNHATTVTLGSGDAYRAGDFGYQGNVSIGDFVWFDADNDGFQDSGEPGLFNAVINLTWHGLDGNPGGGDDITFTTTTDSQGAYDFTGMPPGSYVMDLDEARFPTLTVTTTDPLSGSASAGEDIDVADFGLFGTLPATKQLYLTDENTQGLDRNDPVAGSDATTATSVLLGGVGTLTVRDEFATQAYNNQDGSEVWTTNWIETNDDGGAATGNVFVDATNKWLNLDHQGGGNSIEGIERQADLSGATTANLTFDYVSVTSSNKDDVVFEVSSNGGGNYTELEFINGSGDIETGSKSFQLESFITLTNQVRVRFRLDNKNGFTDAGEYFAADNVQIEYDGVPGATSTTYTQATSLASNLELPDSGPVQLTTHVNVTDGFMPYRPDITATLKYGTTTVATLTDPIYSNNQLVWDGTVPTTTTVPSGQALSLEFTNSQVGVSYEIEYDSLTKPSVLYVHTTSFINVDSLGVYTAPYPGGSSITDALPSDTVYVRLTVSDPFGAADITNVDLTIDDLGCGAVNTTLGAVNVVATAGAMKTYEYAWSVGNCVGSHTIDLSANEGTEGVVHTDQMTFQLVGSSVSDFVWNDLDGDGTQDGGEPGLDGVVVRLLDPNNGFSEITNTTTAGGGAYSFTDLVPGNYVVKMDLPVGWLFSPANVGSDTTDSDADQTTGRSSTVNLSPGEDDTSVDAGIFQPVSISDFVWNDLDGDGVQDGGEPGLTGITVRLLDNLGSLLDTTTTTAGGLYSFTELVADDYIIEVVAPAGYTFSPTDSASATEATDSDVASNGRTAILSPAAGTNLTNVDAGMFLNASISNFVWNDVDADGFQDPAELGLSGVTVRLLDPNNGDAVITSTMTNGSGLYAFNDLVAGDYVVEFVTPSGYQRSPADQVADTSDSDANITSGKTGTINLMAGEDNTTIDAGFYQPANVSNFVWNDLDGDGVQDGGEPGLNGVAVRLLDSSLSLITSTSTTGGGFYSFTGLAPDNYVLEFVTPSGFNPSEPDQGGNDALDSDASLTTGQTGLINLVANESDTSVDAGFFQPATISDLVWEDLDGDGILDLGEMGLDGVTVRLLDPNNGLAVLATDVTSGGGLYSFGNLEPGDYVVEFVLPPNYAASPKDAGGTEATDSDADPTTGRTDTVTVISGQYNQNVDAAFYQPGSISDTVFYDLNANGVQDAGEPGLDGVTVRLLDPNNGDAELATTTTAGGGLYVFNDLAQRNYKVDFVSPGGTWVASPQDQGGDDALDSDADPTTGETGLVSLGLAEDKTTVDAGFYQPAIISNYVWNDIDGDGVQDVGEPPIPGFTVELYDNTVPSSPVFITSTTTDGNGIYFFDNLAAGNYVVKFLNPGPGWDASPQDQGGDDSADSDADQITGFTGNIALAAGEANDSVDAGFYLPPNLGNFVWSDYDKDGIQDVGEPGIEGVTVRLRRASDSVIVDTTTTSAMGMYLFQGFPPGDYVVEFVKPSGYDYVPQGAGGDVTKDSDASATTGITASVNVIAGAMLVDIDAGFFPRATIGNYVWDDLDGDGVQDAGEPPLDGVTVRLLDTGLNVLDVDATADGGFYEFAGLTGGNYIIEFVTPFSYTNSPSNAGIDDAIDSDVTDLINGRTSTISLAPGETDLSNDAGFFKPGTISDYVWNDENGDGIQDGGEDPLGGVTVNLLDPDNGFSLIASTTTNGTTGLYSFTNLGIGNYVVEFVNPGGLVQSPPNQGGNDALDSDANTSNGRSPTIALSAGQIVTNVDAGFFEPATVGSFVWNDENGDGIQDGGETGISGVTVRLLDSVSFAEVASTTTNGSGQYVFDEVPSGSYIVEFVKPGGYEASPQDNPGTTEALDSDADPNTGRSGTIVLSAGDSNNDIDTGFFDPGTLGDFVWDDTNGNGVQDGGEVGIDGVTVNLLDPNDSYNVIGTTDTAGGGAYSFTGLSAGDYALEFVLPAGYEHSPQANGGTAATDSDPDPGTSRTADIALGAAETNNDIDAGLYQPATLGDIVWNDLDGDGVQDLGETGGVGGVQVNLYDDGGALVDTVYTDNLGAYSFTDIAPGNYSLEFIPPGGYVLSPKDSSGGTEATDSDADPSTSRTDTITLTSSETRNDVDAGMRLPATLGNYVWVDENADGAQDVGEPGIPDVNVQLYDATGSTLLASTKTDSKGGYLFSGLGSGTYLVKIDTFFLSLNPTLSANPTFDEDSGTTNPDHETLVTLSAGQEHLSADFGYHHASEAETNDPGTTITPKGAIGDRIWSDDGVRDGEQEPGEAGLAGVTVKLLVDSNGDGLFGDVGDTAAVTTTTDAAGNYLFDDLDPGAYVIEVDTTTLPAGYNTNPTGDPDGDLNNVSEAIVVAPGDVFLNADFGYQNPSNLTLGDTVYLDLDGDGIHEPNGNDTLPGTLEDNETGIPGVTVALLDASNNVIATDTTDSNGNYTFTGLASGVTYTVKITDTNHVLGELAQSGDPDTPITPDGQSIVPNLSASNADQDFGYTPRGHDAGDGLIGDTVFIDFNGNLSPDAGEGLENIVVFLDINGNGSRGTDEPFTTTDENGHYYFGGLDPTATYTVAVDTTLLPGGLVNTVDPDTVGTGDHKAIVNLGADADGIDIDQDFGYAASVPNTVAGTIWEDANADGLLGETSAGIAGVTVNLYTDPNGDGDPSDGRLVGTATTDGSGNYSFGNLLAGDYVIDVTDTADLLNGYWHSDGPTAGADNNSQSDVYSVTLSGGGTNSTGDFGYYKDGASLGDYVWEDTNSNGIQNESGTGIANSLVTLTIDYPDGTQITVKTQTDSNGNYTFGNLLVDEDFTTATTGDNTDPTYSIAFDTPSGFVPTVTGAGTSATDSNGTTESAITVAQGETEDTIDSGFVGPASQGSIGDLVWNDTNGDGIKDGGESGLVGVSVNLFDSKGALVATDVTDFSGAYFFGSLLADDYTVEFIPLPGYVLSPQDATGDTQDSDANPTTFRTAPITISVGENETSIDAGMFAPASIGNYVWVDENADGIQDAGEPGIGGVTVELYQGASLIDTTTTDAFGGYVFTDVLPGSYDVQILSGTLPTGLSANPTYNEDSGTLVPNHVSEVTVSAGEEHLTADFGYNYASVADTDSPNTSATGAIGDLIWNDADENGEQDPGEIGINDVTVRLLIDLDNDGLYGVSAGEVLATTMTNPDGRYIFDTLPEGSYVLDVDTSTLPAGFTTVPTGDPDGDGDNTSNPLVLGPGDVFLNGDFGYHLPAGLSIGDKIYLDLDGDGVHDVNGNDGIAATTADNELGIGGVTVALYDGSNALIGTTLTDAGGDYTFFGLSSGGNYKVVVTDTDRVLSLLTQTGDPDTPLAPDAESSVINLTVNNTAQDFGYAPAGHEPGEGYLGDTIFMDFDGSGTPDFGEGMEGVTVFLDLNNNGTQEATEPWTVTDENGNYCFGGLDPSGTYTVAINTSTLPIGLTNSADPDAGSPHVATVDLSADPDGLTDGINQEQDFGYVATIPNTLSGTVWDDTNADGVLGESGTGLSDVTVALYTDPNGDGDPSDGRLIGTATTDGSGNYSFGNLPDGNYVVDVTDTNNELDGYWHNVGPSAGDGSTDNQSQLDTYQVNLSGGTAHTLGDFGYYRGGAAIGDFVWSDTNSNGVQDGLETGIAGSLVTLSVAYPNGETITLHTVTEADGSYTFGNLLADEDYATATAGNGSDPSYTVTFSTPTGGYIPTVTGAGTPSTDSNGTSESSITLSQGQTDDTIDSGFVGSGSQASIGDLVWNDSNGDGIKDVSESGLEGVTVNLYDNGGTLVATDVTDNSGAYGFSGLLAGNYTVEFLPLSGYILSPQDATGDSQDSDADPDTLRTATISLSAGENNTSVDAGMLAPAAIGNYVWVDENGDGVQDAGEPGVSGVTVELYQGVTMIATTVTASDGGYLFSGVIPGNYEVRVSSGTLPTGLAANPTYNEDTGTTAPDHVSAVTVSAGEEYLTADFGYNYASVADTDSPNTSATGAIGDRIWNDAGNLGTQDPGELGINGVTVRLLIDLDGDGIYGVSAGEVYATTMTGPDGHYIFDALPEGAYVLEVDTSTLPTGFSTTPTGDPDGDGDSTSNPIVLAPGDVILNGDFGYQLPTGLTLGNTIYVDLDGDGVHDPDGNDANPITTADNEPGVAGVTVALLDGSNNVIATTITDANGEYSFEGLPSGVNYTVVVTDKDHVLGELVQTGDPDTPLAPDGQSTVINLTANDANQNFGYAPSGHGPGEGFLGDLVFLDTDGSDTPDPGEGIEGVTVYLDLNTNGTQEASEPWTVTSEEGHYHFGGLDSTGTYTVAINTATLPSGLTNSVDPDDGAPDQSVVNLNSDPDGLTDGINLGQDFGYTASTPNSVAGTVWGDTNADGVLGESGTGIPNVTVALYTDPNGDGDTRDGVVISTVTTDGSGNYSFGNLPDGNYVIDVTDTNNVLAGYVHSVGPNAGDGLTDNQSQLDPYQVTLSGGAANVTGDFGYYTQGAAIGDFVWSDTSTDGIQDGGEPGIAGSLVTLTIIYPNTDTVIVTTLTGPDGSYSFDNLLADEDFTTATAGSVLDPTYSVTFSTPTGGFIPTVTGAGTAATDSNGLNESSITLAQGQSDNTIDSGFVGSGSQGTISDLVWNDLDGDGVQDGGELGLEGVTVNLYNSGGTLIATTLTDNAGAYSFGALLAGNYTVEFIPLSGYVLSPPDAGGDDTLDSDADPITLRTATINLSAGENNSTIDAGMFAPATIGNFVWVDENGDGVQDAGEPGIGGVTVELYQGGINPVASTTTGVDGSYLFTGLVPGTYDVTIASGTLPTGLAANPTYNEDTGTVAPNHVSAVTLTAGQEHLTADFGYNYTSTADTDNPSALATGAIGDRIWNDADQSKTQDPGESGIGDVSVRLLIDLDNDGLYGVSAGEVFATTTTGPDGHYIFDGLPEGAYVIDVVSATLPTGFNTTPTTNPDGNESNVSNPLALGPGDVFLNGDFGYRLPSGSVIIGDHLYVDLDGDGMHDENGNDGNAGTTADNEPGLAGVTVALLEGGSVIATTTTDANGFYSFPGLPTGLNYTVVVTDKDHVLGELTQTGDPDTPLAPDGQSTLNNLGTTNLDQDFGYAPAGHGAGEGYLGDTVFLDFDGSGTPDAGEGIESVVVFLDLNSDGTQQANEPWTTTDENGHYSFGGLDPAGTHTVVVNTSTLPSGLSNSVDPDAGTADQATVNLSSDPDGISDGINLAQDFGYAAAGTPNTLTGTVWDDTNADGVLGESNAGIEFVTISLYTDPNGDGDPSDGVLLGHATTDVDGNYSFGNLPDGNYVVDVTDTGNVLDGFGHSVGPSAGDGFTDNQSQTDTYQVILSGGGANGTADFGYYRDGAAISNFVWNDTNANGIQDGGEVGIAGSLVTLTIVYPNGESVTVNTLTDANGNYSFNNLLADEDYKTATAGNGSDPSYTVTFSTPTGGFIPTATGAGTPSTDSNGTSDSNITLSQGQVDDTIDSGFVGPASQASLGSVVWNDLDGDGVQDPTETSGIEGVRVRLLDPNNAFAVLQETTTDSNGAYSFTGLFPGDYVVEFINPPGYSSSPAGATTNDKDSDADVVTGRTATINLSVGENNNDIDAGFYESAVIGNRVWVDENADGVQDTGEPGIPSAIVNLYDESGTILLDTTTTDADGNYVFKGVIAGNHVVMVDSSSIPSDLAANQTYDQDGTPDHETLVSVLAGQENLTADFGYNWSSSTDTNTPPASIATGAIGDRVWLDADGDGIQDAGEMGILNVTVSLLVDTNGDGIYNGMGDNPPVTTMTDDYGDYLFDGLPVGGYIIEVDAATLPAGVTQKGDPDGTLDHRTTNPLVLGPGDAFLNADFGYQPGVGTSYKIGDSIYIDANGDGIQDVGESLVPSVTVVLLSGGEVVATTMTSATGEYEFPGVLPGTYTVWVNDADNVLGDLVQTGDPDATLDRQSTVMISTADNLDQDFGFAPADHLAGDGFIGDTVFLDLNGNDTLDPLEGIQGVTVELYDATGTTLLESTTTNENGYYGFGGLDPTATYVVQVVTTTLPNSGTGLTNNVDPDTSGPGDSVSIVNLAAVSGSALDEDFGYSANVGNSISGTVWHDTDGAGDLNETGQGIPFITVDLLDNNGNLLSVTQSDINGNYTFDGLPDGSYSVVVSDRDNRLEGYWQSIGASPGSDNNSQANPYSVDLDSAGSSSTAVTDSTADFGYYEALASFGGTVWEDSNGDGIQDEVATGMAGILVTLTIDYPNGDQLIVNTVSDGNGDYVFANLLADEDFTAATAAGTDPTFTVSFATPPTYLPSQTGQGTNATDSNGESFLVTLAQGQTDNTYDSGFVPPSAHAVIGDLVWNDDNNDGIKDVGESGQSGVTVRLMNPGPNGTPGGGDDIEVGSTTTGVNGNYSFTAAPGSYFLEFDAPTGGNGFTIADQGTDTTDSDVNPATGQTIVTTLSASETDNSWDAGLTLVKPDDFAIWQSEEFPPLFSEDGPSDNPDSDIWDNLLEYALCLHPTSGESSHPGFCVEYNDITDKLDAVFVRATGGLTDVSYNILGRNALPVSGDSTWTTVSTIPGQGAGASGAVITDLGNGSEEVRLPDVGGMAPLTSATGFVRLEVSLTSPAATSQTYVFGWNETDIETNQCETFSNPFLKKEAFSGKIDGVAGGDADNKMEIFLNITSGVGIDFDTLLDFTNKSYYIEITSGDFAGHRFDLAQGGLEKLEIAFSFFPCIGPPFNTTATPGTLPSLLAGDSFILREHYTIDEMFPPQLPFVAGIDSSVADRLLFYSGSWNIYYLDSLPDPDHWQLDGEAFANYGGTIVPPSQGLFVHPRSNDVTLLAMGVVRENDFVLPLNGDYTLVPSIYPINQSATDRDWLTKYGSFDIDGGFDPAKSDQFSVWDGDNDGPYVEGYSAYFHLQGAAGAGFPDGWRDSSDAFLSQQNDTALFRKDRSAFLLRRSSSCDATHTLPVPWLP